MMRIDYLNKLADKFMLIHEYRKMMKEIPEKCDKEKASETIRRYRKEIKEEYDRRKEMAEYYREDYDGFVRKTWLDGSIPDYTDEDLKEIKEENWIPMHFEAWDCTGYHFTNWIHFAKFAGLNKIAMYEGIGIDV